MPAMYDLRAEVVPGVSMCVHDKDNRLGSGASVPGQSPTNMVHLHLFHGAEPLWDAYISSPVTASLCQFLNSDQSVIYIGYGLRVYAFGILTGVLLWELVTESPVWSIMDNQGTLLVHCELSLLGVTPEGGTRWETTYDEIVVSVEPMGKKIKLTDFAGRVLYLNEHGDIVAED